MKIDCPACQASINNMDIKERRRSGLFKQAKCPKCNAWLRMNPVMESIKTAGLLVLLVSSLLNVFRVIPALETPLSIAAIIGVSVALIATLTAKMEKV
ncbi:MAG: hypothetical protein ACI910_001174 [Oleispira sp.]|jgi:hypothetical protein